jgi:hypothetical protein
MDFLQRPSQPPRFPLTHIVRLLIMVAGIIGGVLLLTDFLPVVGGHLAHAPFSALPLLLIGMTYALAQPVLHPRRRDLLQAALVILAFLGWGVDQLIPPSPMSTVLGDIVIALYVTDLALKIWERLRGSPSKPLHSTGNTIQPLRDSLSPAIRQGSSCQCRCCCREDDQR